MALENLTEELVYSCKGGIAKLTLNRPDKLNAITQDMFDGMEQVVGEVRNNDDVKVLVITGAGRGFCSGADVVARLAARVAGEGPKKTRKAMVAPVGYIASILHRLDKPIIGAINGVAAGAGLSYALLCDIRIASDQARFGAVWVRRGLIPDVGATYLLPRIIGMDKALELAFTGDLIGAREAERIGLVTKVVPHDDLMKVTDELALKVASGPSVAIELMKRGMYRALDNDLDTQLDFESYAQNLCFGTDDFKEGVAAFREKRDSHFRGR